jgi:hypothetical protein
VRDPGRLEHDIEPAELALNGGNGRIDRRPVAHVERRRGRPPASSANARHGRLGRRAVAVGAEHRRAFARQRLGSGAADATTGADN